MSNTAAAELIMKYVALRDHKAAAKKELDVQLERVNEALDKLEADLLEVLGHLEGDSLKTKSGTAYIREELSVTVDDPEAFMNNVRETENWDILDVKANKTEVGRYLKEDLLLPPGVKTSVTKRIGIRRPTK